MSARDAVSRIGLDLADRIADEQSKPRIAASASPLRMWVYVVFRGDLDAIRRAGFNVVAPLGPVATAFLTIDEIERLAQHENVVSVDLPPRAAPMLDRSVPDIRAPAAWGVPPVNPANSGKGAGAICGIIDTGFDVFHGSLRKPSGESRILFYWDQTFLYDVGTGDPVDANNVALTGNDLPLDETDNVATQLRAPAELTALGLTPFGIEFNDEQINDALARHPDGEDLPVSLRDDGGRLHGTHVAGTAAGDGSERDRCTPPFTYQGVAPEADLIVVKTGFSATRMHHPMAAMAYIFAKARLLGRPCAINISFGGHRGPHNGFAPTSTAIEAALAGTTGRAVIVAGSNDREGNLHVAETVGGGTSTTINLVVDARVDRVLIFGSYDSISTLTYRIRMPRLPPPGAVRQSQIFDPLAFVTQVTQGHTFRTAVHPSQPGDPDRHFEFSITRTGALVEAGTWQIDLITGGAISSNVHLWQSLPSAPFGGFRPFGFQPVAPVANPSPQDVGRPAAWRRPESWISGTMSLEATTRSAITVGAYNAESVNTPIGPFSSQGPALLGLLQGLYPTTPPDKPDIAAPGVAIHAPFASQRKPCFLCCECWVKHHTEKQGTSMAAPHVTGVAALMFAQDPALNAADVKRLMKESARPAPALPAGWPDSALLFGAGNIDAFMCAFTARQSAEARAGGGGRVPVPPNRFVSTPQPVRHPWDDFHDRLRQWERLFGKRPAWQLCAFLISTHVDEVKRLIDTNRRVAAVWQRHGGPALVRRIVFEKNPDPPLPEHVDDRSVLTLIDKLTAVLARYGSAALKADTDRYHDFVRRLPGLRIADIDAALGGVASS